MEYRDSNLELCRIVTMAIIVLNHVVSLGGVLENNVFNYNSCFALLFLLGGKFGTNVFVVLGIYFLVDSKFKFSRILKLWLQTFTYMITLNIFDILVFGVNISLKTWIKSCLPIIGRSYWFASSYLILLLIIPLLNGLYYKIKNWPRLLTFGILIFSLLPTVTFNGNLFGNSIYVRYGFKLLLWGPVWFAFLYILMKWIKENCTEWSIFKREKWFYFKVWLFCYLIMFVIELVMYYMGINGNEFAMNNFSTIRDLESMPCIVGAAAFFMLFKKIEMPYKACVNFIASMTFGIFLLHNHETSIYIFFRGIFNLNIIYQKWYFALYSIVLAGAIFVVGILIESLRKPIERKIFQFWAISHLCEKVDLFVMTKAEKSFH